MHRAVNRCQCIREEHGAGPRRGLHPGKRIPGGYRRATPIVCGCPRIPVCLLRLQRAIAGTYQKKHHTMPVSDCARNHNSVAQNPGRSTETAFVSAPSPVEAMRAGKTRKTTGVRMPVFRLFMRAFCWTGQPEGKSTAQRTKPEPGSARQRRGLRDLLQKGFTGADGRQHTAGIFRLTWHPLRDRDTQRVTFFQNSEPLRRVFQQGIVFPRRAFGFL